MGNYYGKSIRWRCVDIDENGPLMLSDRILCLKPFDAKGSNINLQQQQNPYNPYGSHQRGYSSGQYRKQYGSNYWADSNIRCWLNSRASAGNVKYTCGNPPTNSNVWNGYNEYDQEAGFLTNFNNSELAAIKTVTQDSLLDRYEFNNMSSYGSTYHTYNNSISSIVQNAKTTAYREQVTDSMFLLDVNQINKVYQNDSKLDGNKYYIGIPSPECVANSEYQTSGFNSTNRWYTWLRSPYADSNSSHVRYVYSDGYVYYSNAYYGNYGVQPAFYLNLTSTRFTSGFGTFWSPYTIYGSGKITAGTEDSTVSSNTSPTYSNSGDEVLDKLKFSTESLLQNMYIMNDKVRGPYIDFLGKKMYLFEMDGKVELKLKDLGLPISFKMDLDKKTIKILMGFDAYDGKVDMSAGANKTSYWSESYQQAKSMYQDLTGKKVTDAKLWNKYSSLRGQLKQFDADMLVKAKCTISGFAELSYETGSVVFSEGGIVFSASIGADLTSYIAAVPGLYCTMGLKASADGTLAFAKDEQFSMKGSMDMGLTTNIGIGWGSKKAKVYVEGGAKGTLGVKTQFATGKYLNDSTKDPCVVTITGKVYLEGAFTGFLSGSKEWVIGEPLQLYPNFGASLKAPARYKLPSSKEQIYANATPLSRDYLKDDFCNELAASIGKDDIIYTDNKVYAYNTPSLTTLSDGSLLMLWIDDDGTKNDINKTSLMYSIYENNAWTTPAKVYETGAYNGEPVIYNDGTTVHVIWSRSKTVFGDDATLEQLTSANEIWYTSFTDGSFTEPVMVTNNDVFEENYAIVSDGNQVAIAWVENDNNNPFMDDGETSLFTRTLTDGVLGTAELIHTTTCSIDEVAVAIVNDELYTFYIENEDDKQTVFCDDEKLFEGTYITTQADKLYYLNNETVYSYDISTGESTATAVTGVSNFSIVDGTVYALSTKGFTGELYSANLTTGELEQITAFDRYIRSYSVAKDADGNDVFALNLITVDEAAEKKFQDAELMVCGRSSVNDIAVTNVYFDYDKVKANENLEISFDLLNQGTEDVSTVNLYIKNKQGTVLTSNSVAVDLKAGKSATATINYKLPSKVSLTQLTAEALLMVDDDDLSNNTANFTYGLGDATLTNLTVERVTGGAVFKGKVSNDGYTRLSNVDVYITDATDVETKLDTISCGDLAAGSDYEFEIPVPEQYMTIEDKMTMYGIKAFVETSSEESSYGNNDDKVVFGNLAEHTVTLCDGNEIIDIISYKDFNSYRYRKNGYKLLGWSDGEDMVYTHIDVEPKEDLVLMAEWETCGDEFSIHKFYIERVDGGFNATLDFDYNTSAFNVYYAIYDGDQLIACEAKAATADDQEVTFHGSANLEEKYYKSKLIIWDDNMNPIIDPIEEILYLDKYEYADVVLESPHDYPKNSSETYSYTYDGLCKCIVVKFSNKTETEADADYIYVYDKDDTLVGKFSGTELAGQRVTVPGNTVKIELVSDDTLQAYGFKTDSIEVCR